MNTNGLTLEPCLEMNGQLASVAKCATNRAKSIVLRLGLYGPKQKIETNNQTSALQKQCESENIISVISNIINIISNTNNSRNSNTSGSLYFRNIGTCVS